MAVKEKSFRIGCGRYIQERGCIAQIGSEVLRLGTSPLIVGGKTALSIAKDKLVQSVKSVCKKYEIIEYCGTCNDEKAMQFADIANSENYDVIVGVGGGVIMDFAKLLGFYAKLPVINIPTSSATCAAYTPLSVCYTPEGRTVGTRHYDYEVDAVLADTDILVAQPERLFLAGVFDALAKLVEIKQRLSGINAEPSMGLDYAYVMSQHSYTTLTENVYSCLSDMEKGEVSEAFEKVIFTCIAATGVISGIARGSNQTALAHKFYETTRLFFPEKSKPHLHGEIVGVGLFLQNKFNGEAENNQALKELMKKYDMPSCITDVGVDNIPSVLEMYYEKICNSSAINKNDVEECRVFKECLEYFWNV